MGVAAPAVTLTVTAATLTSLTVSPPPASLPLGLTQQFTATGTYSDGSQQDLTGSVTWTSSDVTVATINSTGLAKTLKQGSVTILAASGSVTSTAGLIVTPVALTISNGTDVKNSAVVPKGYAEQFYATGAYSDGSTADITASVTWSSFAPGVLTISSGATNGGLAKGVTAGSTTITASMNAMTAAMETISTSLPVTVDSETLTTIIVGPASPSVANGATQQFTASGVFSSGQTLDLTKQVTWASSNTNTATISAAGLATAGSPLVKSSVTISAALSGLTGTDTLTVAGTI